MRLQLHPMALAAVSVFGAALLFSCDRGGQELTYGTNLLKNGSFEDVGRDGIPTGWEIGTFRGLDGDQTVEFGIDDATAVDGKFSWRFRADPGTRRFYVLRQEIRTTGDATHVRLRGNMQIDQVGRKIDQFAQCNYLLTFFDEKHHRFQEMRFADKRTKLKVGTAIWFEEDQVFRLPQGTRYVAVSCILGMDGTAWFDNVSLSIPQPMPWESAKTKNFEFHWFPGHPFPLGSMQNQQAIFDQYAAQLHVNSDVVIRYYLYPDTASIRSALSLKGFQYVSWDDREIHTINPNDNHEVVHFITDEYGAPPRSMAEGTVFWLLDDWAGYPIHKVAAYRLKSGDLASVASLTNYNDFARLDPGVSFPAAASFIGFASDRWGVDKLMQLYRSANGANDYGSFSRAFEVAFGVPCLDAEKAWRGYLASVDISDLPALPTVPKK